MSKWLALVAAIAAGVVALPEAYAQGKQDFTLVNKTGYTIEQVYVAPSKSDEWEEDVLGQDVLDDGERLNISFPKRAGSCRWDLRVVYDDADEAEWYDFNLCTTSKITIFYNRKTGETRAEYE